jgi:hemerythrin-like domain-containing protein
MTQTTQPIETSGAQAVDLYREVHKGLRLALFELATAAGRLDVGDAGHLQAFRNQFADVDMMLGTHHAHEDGEHLASLIEHHAGSAARRVEEAHERIDSALAALRDLVGSLGNGVGADEVYDALTDFVAQYLAHMREEESVVMPALQATVPIEDLMAVTMAIRTSVPPADMCVFLRYMLPAMNPDERTGTLGGMKAGAPAEIFDLFWDVAQSSLPQDAVAQLAERIGV